MDVPAARGYRRSLDQHFRALTAGEREIVRTARKQGNAFLLYDRLAGGLKKLDFSVVDRVRAVYIGRAEGTDVTTDWEHSVSGTHAKIEREATVWFLEDLNSKNGTFVGRERIRDRRRLRDGDVFTLSTGAGAPRFEFNCAEPFERTVTRGGSDMPKLRASELRLLSALCVHRLYGEGLDPASSTEMACVLVMSKNSMRSGLSPIYVACGLQDVPPASKRRRLMEFALEHGLARREHLDASPEEILKRLAAGGKPGR